MKIDFFWFFVAVFTFCLFWQGQNDRERCFKAAQAHIELKECK